MPDDLATILFEQAVMANASARLYVRLGRQQFARDVVTWLQANAHRMGDAPMGELIALCRREIGE